MTLYAQRRPGRLPRRHDSRRATSSVVGTRIAQRRPGRLPRRHHVRPRRPQPQRCSLNEGRGAYPGDTVGRRVGMRACLIAQRRPGRLPRRHAHRPQSRAQRLSAAQRRPGRLPRRHERVLVFGSIVGSTLNEGRGAYPGDTAIIHDLTRHDDVITLNEGRGAYPGDTPIEATNPEKLANAQRRPGRLPRRHLNQVGIDDPHLANAQRRPGRLPRRHAYYSTEL